MDEFSDVLNFDSENDFITVYINSDANSPVEEVTVTNLQCDKRVSHTNVNATSLTQILCAIIAKKSRISPTNHKPRY